MLFPGVYDMRTGGEGGSSKDKDKTYGSTVDTAAGTTTDIAVETKAVGTAVDTLCSVEHAAVVEDVVLVPFRDHERGYSN